MSKHFTLPYEGGLIEKNLPAGILHTYEKIWTKVYQDSRPASYAVADIIEDAIKNHKDGLSGWVLQPAPPPLRFTMSLHAAIRPVKSPSRT